MTSTFEIVSRRAREVESGSCRITASASLVLRLVDEFEKGGGSVHSLGGGQFMFGHLVLRLDTALPRDTFKIEVR
jgi:hypothetical protein